MAQKEDREIAKIKGRGAKCRKCCRCGDYPAYRRNTAGNYYCIKCSLDLLKKK